MRKREVTTTVVVALIALAALICSFAAASLGLPKHRAFEVSAALLGAVVAIATCAHFAFDDPPEFDDSGQQEAGLAQTKAKDRSNYSPAAAVAVNITIFLSLGFAAIVVATEKWPAAILWAGTALLAGGFLGLLFGIPLSVTPDPPKTGGGQNPAPAAPVSTNQAPNTLLAETASTISKFLTGAIAIEFKNIYAEFKQASNYLGQYLDCCGGHNSSLAGGILLYFTALGFVSGLLLPRYFLPGITGLDVAKGARIAASTITPAPTTQVPLTSALQPPSPLQPPAPLNPPPPAASTASLPTTTPPPASKP